MLISRVPLCITQVSCVQRTWRLLCGNTRISAAGANTVKGVYVFSCCYLNKKHTRNIEKYFKTRHKDFYEYIHIYLILCVSFMRGLFPRDRWLLIRTPVRLQIVWVVHKMSNWHVIVQLIQWRTLFRYCLQKS